MSANWSFLVSKQAAGTSPPNVALEQADLDQVLKLMLLCTLATVGTVGNVFAISAVLLETSLKTRGNVFVVNLALAALLVSALAIPASAVVILAGVPQDKGACNFRWAAAVLSCHVSVLSLMFTALESHARFTSAPCHGPLFGHWAPLTAALLFTWAAPAACVACQFLLCLGPDYCELSFRGNLVFLLTTGSLLICAPIALALASYARTLAVVRSSAAAGHDHALPPPPQAQPAQRRLNNANPAASTPPPSPIGVLAVSSRDVERLRANIAVFAAFLATWLPLGIALAVGSVSPISGGLFDALAWLALSNSCVQGFIYAIGDRHFRKIYRKLFHYCCCKTSVSFARRNRHDCAPSGASLVCAASADSCSSAHQTSSSGLHRYHSSAAGHGESASTAPAPAVRVHIIPGYNIYAASQQRRLAQAAAATTTVSHSQHQGNNVGAGNASSAPGGCRAKRDDGKRMCAYYNASGGCVVANAAQRNPYEL